MNSTDTTDQTIDPVTNPLADINKNITEAYDKQVYTSNAFPFSSPGHLRAAAHLYNLETVPLENARVLELGCAGGGNLLPFAVQYPNAHVVGVDLSSVQIAQGQQVVQALGLNNLHLKAMCLTDITPEEFGQFDYIISHGVFSWIPPEVREAMMRIVRDHLSPNGIAYISYNTYPGWKAGDIVRDAMLLHSHSAQNEEEKIASAKAMLNLLSEGIAQGNPLAPSLRAAVAQLRKHSDYYIAHEYLEIFNSPCYLLEFVNMADQYDLTHVGDAEPHVELSATFGQNVQLNHSLIAMGQAREVRQQYLDFAVGRNFRKSLLVHKDRAHLIPMSPDTDKLTELYWAGHFTAEESDKNTPKNKRVFRNHKNLTTYTRYTAIVSIFNALSAAWPAPLSVNTLSQCVAQDHPHMSEEEISKLVLRSLKTLFQLNNIRYCLEPPALINTPDSNKSQSITLTLGAQHLLLKQTDQLLGLGTYNLWHETTKITLKEAEVFVISCMNGERSRKQLAVQLRDALHRGFVQSTNGDSLKGQRNLDAQAEKIVVRLLELLQYQALLVSN